MNKLEELEKALKEYQELLKNAMMGYPDISPAAATNMGGEVNKGDEDKKEDEKMIEEKLDEHNEKKHGEAKDVDSAKKSEINMEVIKFDNNNQWSL